MTCNILYPDKFSRLFNLYNVTHKHKIHNYFKMSIIHYSVYYYFNEEKLSFENFDKAVIHVVFCLPLAMKVF